MTMGKHSGPGQKAIMVGADFSGSKFAARASSATPEVSIIIPSFNEAKYLEACLRTIKAQKTAKSYEIILGDGHSSDRTAEIARNFGARIVLEDYHTPAGGRHMGALAAKGKILVFANADVEVQPGWLDGMLEPFDNPSVVWAMGRIAPLNGTGFERLGGWFINLFVRTLTPNGIPYCYSDNMAVRADAYRKSGGFLPKHVTSEDTHLAMKLMKIGKYAYATRGEAHLSMRRVRKWGYCKFILFNTKNFFLSFLFSKQATDYEPIR
jgi:glycosyltransferase involved in cell wall biosynthesis